MMEIKMTNVMMISPAHRTVSRRVWQRVALVGVLLLAVFLHVFRLEQEGYANLYYAAAVKSMLTSWRNFFFVSFDAGGFVTVDKPPLGLWMQAISAALFGFNGISLLLPQVVAGVLSVLLLYHLVQRTFGPAAGLLAALTLAVTPIFVAANRNNTMDSQLVLLLLLAAWAALRAVETGRLRWLLACAVLVGLGFNVKMLQAFLALPAFYLLYLVAAPARWWKRILHLGLATVVLLVVSFAWVVAVDLTPPDQRPYIGSSSNNTVMELIVGHNGLARLLPGGRNWMARLFGEQEQEQTAAPGQNFPSPDTSQSPPGDGGQVSAPPQGRGNPPPPPSGQPHQPSDGPFPPAGGPLNRPGQSDQQPPQPGGGGFSHETGDPGLFRLFNRQLAGQISWLLPLVGLGCLVAAWQTRPRFPLDRRHQNLLLWAAWLLPMVVFFSVANLFHRYYLEMLAPAAAALVGIGVLALWREYRRPDGREWRGWLLPLALLGSAGVEAVILSEFPAWSRWLTPTVVGLCLAAAVALIAARFIRRGGRTWARVAAGVGVLALLLPMAIWAGIPVWYGGHTGLPYAGPELLQDPQRGASGSVEVGQWAEELLDRRTGETYLVATSDAQTAAPIILATGEPVMALGGFSGGDHILTADQLAERVDAGEVRFFLVGGRPGQRGSSGDLTEWVTTHCQAVPTSGGGPVGLFDCADRVTAES